MKNLKVQSAAIRSVSMTQLLFIEECQYMFSIGFILYGIMLCSQLDHIKQRIMQNLKIQGIFPSSISDISYANEESEITYSIANHAVHVHPQRQQPNFSKNGDKNASSYQITINGPQSFTHPNPNTSNGDMGSHIQPEKMQRYIFSKNSADDYMGNNSVPRADKPEYRDKVNGYDINRESLSEEELLRAFQIIDINKDDTITEEDLSFVLDYLKQDYTGEQLKEMISMLSSDRNYVTFDDFKKLGRKEIIPLANFRSPDHTTKTKASILKNIEENDLMYEDPTRILKNISRGNASHSRFEELRKAPKKEVVITEEKRTELMVEIMQRKIPLKTAEGNEKRRQQFMNVNIINIKELMKNYQQHKDKPIAHQQIESILQISAKEARELYPLQNSTTFQSLLVVVQAILYSSRLKALQKLRLMLDVVDQGNSCIGLKQLAHLLMLLKGFRDTSIENKLKAVFKSRGIELGGQIEKMAVWDLVSEYVSVFLS